MAPREAAVQEEEADVLELPERRHQEGCPMDPDRLEWHEADATSGKYDGRHIEIVRCVDCGGEQITPLD